MPRHEDTLSVVIPPELRQKITLAADSEMISGSAIVRKALKLYFLLNPVAEPTESDSVRT